MTEHPTAMPYVWGATSTEIAATYPSERFAGAGSVRAVRAVDTDASPSQVFDWLCQLRRAPYSYDLLDNFGRRSPRTLDADLFDLEVGQTFMTTFTLVDFVPDESITLVLKPGWPTRLFGPLACTYTTYIDGAGGTRLLCTLEIPPAGRLAPGLRRRLLTWGDWLMMRKQLRTLAELAETGR